MTPIWQSGNRSCSQAAGSMSWNPISSDATGRLGETDCAEETEEREEMLTGCDRLVRDIQKFLRRHFSYEDYRIFMLRFYETGSSFRTIARHMGEKTSVVTRRAQAMMESVRANRKFIARRRLIMAGEAA